MLPSVTGAFTVTVAGVAPPDGAVKRAPWFTPFGTTPASQAAGSLIEPEAVISGSPVNDPFELYRVRLSPPGEYTRSSSSPSWVTWRFPAASNAASPRTALDAN